MESVRCARVDDGALSYMLRWSGYGPEDDEWVPAEHCNCDEKIDEFWTPKVTAVVPPDAFVLEPFSASLRLIDVTSRVDRFLEVQVVSSGGDTWIRHYYGDSGQPGTHGAQLLDRATAIARFRAELLARTGHQFGTAPIRIPGMWCSINPPGPPPPGRWEYYLDAPMDTKLSGWHPYSDGAVDTLEAVYSEWMANPDLGLDIRCVQSGVFSYRVMFDTMQQTNLKTSTTRPIRRIAT